uniref:TraB domain containing n=1 Tax=Lepisosteus oculatus TaxID=7918 RepID=W5NEL7_LEPOC
MDQSNNTEEEPASPDPDDEMHALPSLPPGLSDTEAVELLWQVRAQRRQASPVLPETVTQLQAPDGSVVYLVGTAHFSDSSKRDVAMVRQDLETTQSVIEKEGWSLMLRLTISDSLYSVSNLRLKVNPSSSLQGNHSLSADIKTLILTLALNLTQGSFIGSLRLLMNNSLIQASRVPFCKFHLGDRPIPVTFKRAIAALSLWQKLKLAWGLCFLSDPISKEDVEKCKQKDLLEQTMAEMIGEFPDLHRTIVAERDVYLTYTLRQAARSVEAPPNAQRVPAVVVGVVGIGHVPGIEKNWEKPLNIQEIMSVAPPSRLSRALRTVLKGAVLGALGYAFYRAGGGVGRMLLSLPAVQSLLRPLRPPP